MIPNSRTLIYLIIASASLLLGCIARGQHNNSTNYTDATDKQDIVAKLKANDHLSVSKQITLYRQLKNARPDAFNFENEDQLTMYGYGMLWDDRPADALQIFQLIADEFPESANAYDSLGEAYYVLGEKDQSLANYNKSLQMNPDNYNAEDYIERIKYPNKKRASPAELFSKVFAPQEYKADLDDLSNKLIKTHPSIFKFTSKEEFDSIVAQKKALITDKTTYATFRWHCNEIVAAANCSHTGMGSFFPENDMLPTSKRFPLQTVWIDDRLYVTDALDNSQLVDPKSEIISINGKSSSAIIADIYKHIPSQGNINTSKRLFFNKWSTGLMAYALGFPEKYSIQIQGIEDPITLKSPTSHNDPIDGNPIEGCGEPLCLEYVDDDTAILSIYSFNFYRWNNYDQFVDYIDRSFLEIKEKDIKNLIVDVRENGGGAPEASIHLLQYLADRPFTYFADRDPIDGGGVRQPNENAFQGKQYYLMDGYGNSTTGHFMAMVKDMDLGTVIGEELGSNHFCSAGQTIFKLKHTRLQFHSANNKNWVTANALPDDRGILPDHYVSQDITDYLNKVDVVKNYGVELTRE